MSVVRTGVLSRLILDLKHKLAQIADSNVFVSYFIYRLLTRATFLLPHDRSYYAFRYFFDSRPEGLFLDLGANNGISALSFRRLNKSYDIFSIEPNMAHQKSLQRIAGKDNKFQFRMEGVGEKSESLVFFIPYYYGLTLHTAVSCDRSFLMDQIKSIGVSVDKVRIREHLVAITPVDSLGLFPALIKIDCEGHELPILKGAKKTIINSQPVILMEYSQDILGGDYTLNFKAFLDECQYGDYYFEPDSGMVGRCKEGHYENKTGGRNILLIPDSRVNEIPEKFRK